MKTKQLANVLIKILGLSVLVQGIPIILGGLDRDTGAVVKVALMKGKVASPTGSCSDNTPKRVDIQTCIITCYADS